METKMQAIRTRYHGATNTKGSRLSAKGEAKTMYFGYDHALGSELGHATAAHAYANSLGWLKDGSKLIGGVFGNDHYWVIVKGNGNA
jgi:hypothetical protein